MMSKISPVGCGTPILLGLANLSRNSWNAACSFSPHDHGTVFLSFSVRGADEKVKFLICLL